MSKKITELTAGTIKADSLFVTVQSGALPTDPLTTVKNAATEIGAFVNAVQTYAEINNATPISAISSLMSAVNDLTTALSLLVASLPVYDSTTLEAGETTITFTNIAIVEGCAIRPFNKTDVVTMPDSAVIDTVNHTVELTYSAQAVDMVVGIEIIPADEES